MGRKEQRLNNKSIHHNFYCKKYANKRGRKRTREYLLFLPWNWKKQAELNNKDKNETTKDKNETTKDKNETT